MANCEVCGSSLRGRGQLVEIEGAIVTVCQNCARLGRPLKVSAGPPSRPARPLPKQPAPRPQIVETVELEVRPDYARLVRQARERLNLKQEELGQRAGERTSTISLIERGRLKPSIPMARKLEHVLRLQLLIPVEEGPE